MSTGRRLIALAMLTALLPAGASAQTPDDVAMRDELIAAQENLLNDYRCLFGVDADQVPGGCPDPDRVAPGPAPESPTKHDLSVRDDLIAAQEALLNKYRCKLSVDVGLVPGGCRDGAPISPDARGPYPDPPNGVVGETLPVDGWVFEMTCGARKLGPISVGEFQWTTWYADVAVRIVARDERPWDRLRSFELEHFARVDGQVVAKSYYGGPVYVLPVGTPELWTPHGDGSWRLVGGRWSGTLFEKRTGGGLPDRWFRYELRGGFPERVPSRHDPFEAGPAVTCGADPTFIQDREGQTLLGDTRIGS